MTQKVIHHLVVSPQESPIPLWLPENAELLGVGSGQGGVAIAYEEPIYAPLWKNRRVLVVYEAQAFRDPPCKRRFLGWTSLTNNLGSGIVYVFELLD